VIAGIDPGAKGGVAFLHDDGSVAGVAPLPYLGRQVDVVALDWLLDTMQPAFTWVELQVIRQSQAGALSVGANFGRLLGLLELRAMPHDTATPKGWMHRAGLPSGLKHGKPRNDAMYLAAKKLWGAQIDQLRPSNDGQVAALLIARYGAKT
jgi:hypothetical protein